MVKSMKRNLKWIRNERGQMLIFVLISTSIILLVFITAVKMYINIIEDSHFLLEQLEVETISQMSKMDLLNDIEEARSTYYYMYPNGNIELTLQNKNDTRYILNNEIKLKNGSAYETTYEINIE